MNFSDKSMKELVQIPGVGKSIAKDLISIGIESVRDLRDKNPEALFELVNVMKGSVQDRCLLYVLRCAVYYASTEKSHQRPDKLKWWNWKDPKSAGRGVRI
jgi:Pathogenicity locus